MKSNWRIQIMASTALLALALSQSIQKPAVAGNGGGGGSKEDAAARAAAAPNGEGGAKGDGDMTPPPGSDLMNHEIFSMKADKYKNQARLKSLGEIDERIKLYQLAGMNYMEAGKAAKAQDLTYDAQVNYYAAARMFKRESDILEQNDRSSEAKSAYVDQHNAYINAAKALPKTYGNLKARSDSHKKAAEALMKLSEISSHNQDYDSQEKFLQKASDLYLKANKSNEAKEAAAAAHSVAAASYADAGNHEAAAAAHSAAAASYADAGNHEAAAEAHSAAAGLYADASNHKKAADSHKKAVASHTSAGHHEAADAHWEAAQAHKVAAKDPAHKDAAVAATHAANTHTVAATHTAATATHQPVVHTPATPHTQAPATNS